MIEAWLGQHLISFDGRVLEVWGPTSSTGRLHIAAIKDAVIESLRGNELYIDFKTIWGAGNILIKFPAEQRAVAEHIASAVRRARASQGG